jgi:hypothetical protein
MQSSDTRDEVQHRRTDRSIGAILRACCRNQAPAIILALKEAKAYYNARLASISGDSLTLRLMEEMDRDPIIGEDYCATFNYQNGPRAIFASVLEYRHKLPSKSSELVLKLRSGIIGLESRMAYRVNVEPGSSLKIRLITKDGSAWKPKVIDLSLSGMFIDFGDQGKYPKLFVGSEVELGIKLSPHAVTLKGEVKRRVGPRYGIFFPTVATKQGLTPPPALRRIMSVLEREWQCARHRRGAESARKLH